MMGYGNCQLFGSPQQSEIDHVPIAITRQRGKPVVMIDLDDWNAMNETRYLLATPNNARWLLESIAEFDEGKGVIRDLIEP
jgi:antitoxin YefM